MISQKFEDLGKKINESKIFCGQTKLICIDGPAGSGKSTFALNLAGYLDNCKTIHMDDVYEGWDKALSSQLVNDLKDWFIDPLDAGKPISFKKFDWSKLQRSETISFPNPKYLILEGVGAASKGIRERACQVIWVEVDQPLGYQRVILRDGMSISEEMKTWQKLETIYFAENETKNSSALWVDGDSEAKIDTSSNFWGAYR